MTATSAPAKAKYDFPTVRIHHEGRDVNAHEIVCVQCKTAKDHIVCSNGTGRLPPEMLNKKFKQRGWYVRGRKRICPDCLAQKSAAQSGRPKPSKKKVNLNMARPYDPELDPPLRQTVVPPVPAVPDGALEPPRYEPVKTVDYPGVVPREHAEKMARHAEAVRTGTASFRGALEQETVMKADAPKEMTPADRRRIFREVDGNWDEGKAMYLGDVTDQTLADKLNVPRAWVATVRKEAFGDTDKNESMIRVLAEARDLRAKVEKYGNAALDAAAALERLTKSYDALIEKLEGKL